MPVSRWTAEILDGFAPAVSYEIRVTVSQLSRLVEKYGDTIPSPDEGFVDSTEDALLHSSLMHLRSLDDFFNGGGSARGGGRPPDIRASDWVKWAAEPWLDPRVRSQIDWQVVHLSTLREMPWPKWQLPRYGAALCSEVERFFKAVGAECKDRLPAFDHNPWEEAKNAAAIFDAYV